MARKHKPEEIIGKLREAEIVLAQGGTVADACRRIGVTEQSYYRWRKCNGHPNRSANSLIRHTCKSLSGLAVCVCFSERVREGFERTESNTESNCALFSPLPGTPQHTQNGPLSRVERGLRNRHRGSP